MMKPALFFIAASILNGADMTGQYHLRGMMEVASELLLRPDGSFEFGLGYPGVIYWGRGTWKTVDGAVILTSERSKRKDPFVLLKSEAGKAGETRVKLVAADGQVVPDTNLYFLVPDAKPVVGRTDSDGIAVFPSNSERRSIVWEVPEYQYRSKPFVLDAEHHDFTFEVNGNGLMEVVFNDERLRIDNGALIMKRTPEAPEMRYVK